MKTVFLFSGQGSQYYQMGHALFESNPVFRGHMQRLDGTVRALTGHSVLDTLYAPANTIGMPFDRTLLSHPAIVMVEYALARTLIEAGVVPDIVLGASLGSYAAACVAGAIGVEEALALAVAHARALGERCQPGGMIAVLDDPALAREDFLRPWCEVAAVNFASHFVLSAPASHCARIEAGLRERDLAFQRIPVGYAFHSRWIDDARADFEARARGIALRRPQVPVVCCEQAGFVPTLSAAHFWDVTRHPIRFPEAVAELESMGAHRYLDVGPSGTLAVFLKYLLPAGAASTAQAILTPYGQNLANLERLLAPC